MSLRPLSDPCTARILAGVLVGVALALAWAEFATRYLTTGP